MKTKSLFVAVGVLLAALDLAPAQPAPIQPAVVKFTSSNYSVEEIGGSVFITVELNWGDAFNVIMVDYATANATATAGADYVPQSGTLRFEYPESVKTINIPILDDGRAEGNETFCVGLNNLTCADPADCYGLLGSATNTVVTILDNERLVNVDTSFQSSVGGFIRTIVEQPDRRLVIAGDFGLARLNADGSLDDSFNPGTGVGHVHVLELQSDGKILIAGSFDTVNGIERTNLARLNPDGSVDRGFDAGSAAASLWASEIVLSSQADGKVLLAGYEFDATNYLSVFLRLNADGSRDTGFLPSVSGFIKTVVLEPDGKVIVGGYFHCTNGFNCTNLARLNPDGTLDPGFRPDIGDRGVEFMFRQLDGRFVIAQSATERFYEQQVIRLNIDGSPDTSLRPAHPVWRLHAVQSDSKFVVEVLADCPGDDCIGLLERWNADGSVDPSFQGVYFRSRGAPVLSQRDGNVLIAGGYQWQWREDWLRWGEDHFGPLRLFGQQTAKTAVEFAPTIGAFASEGGAAELIVQRFGDLGENVTVAYASLNGTALAGLDYSGMTGHLTFAPNEVEKVISIPVYADHCTESEETFTVILRADGALLGFRDTKDVTVRDTTPYALRFCSIERLPEGQVRFTLNTLPGWSYTVQASTNLADWFSAETRIAADWISTFTDTNGPGSRRFYRAVSP